MLPSNANSRARAGSRGRRLQNPSPFRPQDVPIIATSCQTVVQNPERWRLLACRRTHNPPIRPTDCETVVLTSSCASRLGARRVSPPYRWRSLVCQPARQSWPCGQVPPESAALSARTGVVKRIPRPAPSSTPACRPYYIHGNTTTSRLWCLKG